MEIFMADNTKIKSNMNFGLVGFPLEHSFSPDFFNKKFETLNIDGAYSLFPLQEVKELKNLIHANPNLKGLNVTIPHKQNVIPFLDSLDSTAEQIGAVNTIVIKNGKTKGYNTDWIGFKEMFLDVASKRMLEKLRQGVSPGHALILGSGGSSAAVRFALMSLGFTVDTVSRNPSGDEIGYDQIDSRMMDHVGVVVNTTPAGMYPNILDHPPFPFRHFNGWHLAVDLIYNPEKTAFLKKAEFHGARTTNGMPMLNIQAEEAWKIWNRPNQ
jgi:shikimate dehydrogenase